MASKMNKPQLYEEYKKINHLLSTAQERQRMLELFNNIQGTENTRMRNEIKKLKEHKLNREEQLSKIADIVGYKYPNIDNNEKLINEIKKLKEEIEELKEENENSIEIQAYEGYQVEYEKLKEENIKHQEKLYSSYLENEKLKEKIESMKCSWGGDK